MMAIADTLLFCGCQIVAIRGHREPDTRLLDLTEPFFANSGNFLALLNLMARNGCDTLKQQFNVFHGSTYQSPQIQNELNMCIGDCIQKDIVAEVKEARFFSILVDEAADSANFEQMPLVLQYVNRDGIPREDFIAFLQVEWITGAAIVESILEYPPILGRHRSACCRHSQSGIRWSFQRGCQTPRMCCHHQEPVS